MKDTDFGSYADDNTPNRAANAIDEVILSLEHVSNVSLISKWKQTLVNAPSWK